MICSRGYLPLQVISLNRNYITHLEPGTFTNLDQLIILGLHTNLLTTLDERIFNGSIPQSLTLILGWQSLWCDVSLCWLARAERTGSVQFQHFRGEYFWNQPDCGNYPQSDWTKFSHMCPMEEG